MTPSAFPLALHYRAAAVRPAAAVLLPGRSVAEVVSVVAAWPDGAAAGAEYFPVGEFGWLVVPARLPAGLVAPGAAFGWIGNRLLVPVEAEVHPPLAPEEADHAASRWERVLWHPTLGARGWDRADALRLADLLTIPRAGDRWNAARPGPDLLPPLRAIQLILPPSLGALFGEESADIGREPVQPDASPRPGEPTDGALDRMRRRLAEGIARGLLRLTRNVPRTASAPTWINRVEEWAAGLAERATADLDHRRHRAIDELLTQLEANPDEALKRAIPLGSLPGAETRGKAPPSWELGRRNLDFNLPGLLGARPADDWALNAERTRLLRERYLALANREMQLGRFRRAACIFAELLRDLPGAAATLRRGRHFAEAAELYEKHLRQPLPAAECLGEGGFTRAAVALYEKLGRPLDAARLLRAAGEEEAARDACRRGVASLLARDLRVEAARVLEEHLAAPDEAAAVLREAWPDGTQASECLREFFALGARHGRPEAIRQALRDLRPEAHSPRQRAALFRVFADAQAAQTEAPLRDAMADLAREHLAAALPSLAAAARRELVRLLPRFAPDDGLLARDASRYALDQRDPPLPPPRRAEPAPPGKMRRVEAREAWRLPPAGEWRRAMANAAGVLLVARKPEQLTLAWHLWSRPSTSIRKWPCPPERPDEFLVFAADPGSPRDVLLALESPAGTVVDLPRRTIELVSPGVQPTFDAGTPSHLPRGILAAAYSDESLLTVRHNLDGAERLLLERAGSAGEILSTRALELPPEMDVRSLTSAGWVNPPVVLAAHGGWTFVGIGDLVLRGSEDSGWSSDSHSGLRVTGFAKTARHARPGFAVTLERGVRLIWPGVRGSHDEDLDVPGERPLAAFTGGGLLVTAGGGRGQVWDVAGGRGSRVVGNFPAPEDLCAVTAGQEPRDFHLFSPDGTVRPFRVG